MGGKQHCSEIAGRLYCSSLAEFKSRCDRPVDRNRRIQPSDCQFTLVGYREDCVL